MYNIYIYIYVPILGKYIIYKCLECRLEAVKRFHIRPD